MKPTRTQEVAGFLLAELIAAGTLAGCVETGPKDGSVAALLMGGSTGSAAISPPATNKLAMNAFESKLPDIAAQEKAADEAAAAGDSTKALGHLVTALSLVPNGAEAHPRVRNLFEKAIREAGRTDPPPAVPEQARSRGMKGLAFVKMAKSPEDYDEAAEELTAALRVAPWWADAWVNLALVEEKRSRFDDAAQDLRLYLLAAPSAPDSTAIENKIVELEVASRQAQRGGIPKSDGGATP